MVQSQFRTYNELKASTFKPTTRLPAETLWAILQNVMLYCLMNQIKALVCRAIATISEILKLPSVTQKISLKC